MSDVSARDLARNLPGLFTVKDLKGQPAVVVTISKAGLEEVGQDKEAKPVLRFLETNKGLVLNATRTNQLEGIYGDKPLVGQKIKIGVREEEVRGRPLELICIDSP